MAFFRLVQGNLTLGKFLDHYLKVVFSLILPKLDKVAALQVALNSTDAALPP